MKARQLEELLAINFPKPGSFSTIEVIRLLKELNINLSDAAVYKHIKNLYLTNKLIISHKLYHEHQRPTTFYKITALCNSYKQINSNKSWFNNSTGIYLQQVFHNLGKDTEK